MQGRKPYPYAVISATNGKSRFTKQELEERKRNEPRIESAALRCPVHLTPEAKKEWKRITKLYKELSAPIVTDLDVNALEIYCEAIVTYRKAMQKVHETSEVYVNRASSNKPAKNPWLTVANEAATQVKRYGEVLLLDPVSRARASLAKDKETEDDPMARLLGG